MSSVPLGFAALLLLSGRKKEDEVVGKTAYYAIILAKCVFKYTSLIRLYG